MLISINSDVIGLAGAFDKGRRAKNKDQRGNNEYDIGSSNYGRSL